MKEEQFIKTNSSAWKELDNITLRINNKGIKNLSSNEVKRFLHLFRQSSHHLAYARTHYPKSSLVSYLNSLIGKCHSNLYAVRKTSLAQLVSYVLYGFPKMLKEYKYYILASFGFFLVGLILSLVMVVYNPDSASFFLPASIVENVQNGPAGSISSRNWDYPLMSSSIMRNNIIVSLKTFVFGITLGLGTIYVLFFNGAMLGALTALIYMYGNPINYWSLILPHGIIELTAIFISGASGLIIAKGMLLPGEYSRRNSLIHSAKKAASLLMGVVFMLIIAGIIEGFFTPLEISVVIKLSFAAVTAIILAIYFMVPYLMKRE